jgi:hypothetical protein
VLLHCEPAFESSQHWLECCVRQLLSADSSLGVLVAAGAMLAAMLWSWLASGLPPGLTQFADAASLQHIEDILENRGIKWRLPD